jgi:hypothetical protein
MNGTDHQPRADGPAGGRIALGVFALFISAILILDWLVPFSAAEPQVRAIFPLLGFLVLAAGVFTLVLGVNQLRRRSR